MEHNFLPVPFPPNSSSDDDSSLFWWQRTPPPPLRVRPPIAPFRKSVSVVRDSTSVARSREIYTQLYGRKVEFMLKARVLHQINGLPK